MKTQKEYHFPNAIIRTCANGACIEFPKWCPAIHVNRTRAYTAQALRKLREFKRTGKAT